MCQRTDMMVKQQLICKRVLYFLDPFADELPCFSVDELWNDDELALILNDDNDTFASSPDPYSWEIQNNSSSQSHYFKPSAPERCQKKPNVKSQEVQMSDEAKLPLSRSSQFITGSKAKVVNSAPSSVGHSQPKGNPRRISHPLPPPPPTPGADDFEMSHTGSATRAYNKHWDAEPLNHYTTARIDQRQTWSSLAHDPVQDVLEKDDWDVLPAFTKPQHRTNISSSNQEIHNPTNLESSVGATSLDPLVMQERICLVKGSVSAIDNDFSTDRCEQR